MSNPQHPSLVLTEPQRRHFEVVLAKLEDALDQVDRLSGRDDASTSQPVLTVLDDDLPPGFAERTADASGALRESVASLALRLGLTPRRASRFRTVRALLVAERVRLEESYSRALRGYGALDPRVPDLIDPALAELVALLASMLRALDTAAPVERGGDHDA